MTADYPPTVKLGMIQDYAKLAREALADEHEGNTRHYVEQLAGLADELRTLVQSW